MSYLPLPDYLILFALGVVIGLCIGYARRHPKVPRE